MTDTHLDDTLHFFSMGPLLSVDPSHQGKAKNLAFGFEVDEGEDDDEPLVLLHRLGIDLSKIELDLADMKSARKDAKIMAKAIDEHGEGFIKLLELLKTDPAQAADFVRDAGLTEEDFRRQGGGLWILVVAAIAVLAAGCSSPSRRPEEAESSAELETEETEATKPKKTTLPDPNVINPCGYEGPVINVTVTGTGSSRSSTDRASRRAREDARIRRSEALSRLNKLYQIKCAPPCVPQVRWSRTFDSTLGGSPQKGGRGLKLDFNSKGKWSFGGTRPSGSDRIVASHTYYIKYQKVCARP